LVIAMPPLGSASATVIIAVGLAGFWGAAVTPTARFGERSVPAVAAFAWAQTNCDSTLNLRKGAPRVQAEDLFRVAAAYDAERDATGLKQACRHAMHAAASVEARAPAAWAARNIQSLFTSPR
jgi:hypothetical protein